MRRGADRHGTAWFLQYDLGVNYVALHEPAAHGAWNAIQSAARDMHGMNFVHKLLLTLHLRVGPPYLEGARSAPSRLIDKPLLHNVHGVPIPLLLPQSPRRLIRRILVLFRSPASAPRVSHVADLPPHVLYRLH